MFDEYLVEGLNDAQRDAVVTSADYVRVIAGAGSGKTKVLTHRIAYLLSKKLCQPYEILAITFTNKAAAEMKERIRNLVGESARDIWVMTYHAFCARVLRYHIHLLGYPNDFVILDQEDQKAILKDIYKKYGLKSTELPLQFVLSQISKYKNAMLSVAAAEKLAFTDEEKQVIKLYQEYDKYVRKQQALDFDDLLLKTIELFMEESEVLARYATRFRYIHVDEFQDTNDIQFKLISMLSQVHHHLYIVGDPDQAIYSWRGANDQLILDFAKMFDNAQTVTLEQNYRSTQTILDAANALIVKNKDRLKKNLFSAGDKGDAIVVYEAMDEKQEAEFIAVKVTTLLREHGQDILKDIAILYRSNYLSRNLEESFIKHGLPYTIYGDIRFFERKEIKDMLAYLRLVLHLDQDLSFQRIINEPKRNVGPKTFENIETIAAQHGCSLFDGLKIMVERSARSKLREQLMAFSQTILELHEHINEYSLDELLLALYQRSGYEKMLENDVTQKGRIENIKEFMHALAEFTKKYEHEEHMTKELLGLYLQEVALFTSSDKEQFEASLSLMTVHAAKGLEFKYVFIAGFNDGIFPSKRSIEEGNLEEERRLAYVAITRAKERLHVTYPRGYNMISKTNNTPSNFLYEANILAADTHPFYEKKPKFSMKISDMKEKKNKPMTHFQIGEKVEHPKFGEGLVVQIEGDFVTVAFNKEYGIKTLMNQFLQQK